MPNATLTPIITTGNSMAGQLQMAAQYSALNVSQRNGWRELALMHSALAAIWSNEFVEAELLIDQLAAPTTREWAQPEWTRSATNWLQGLLDDRRGNRVGMPERMLDLHSQPVGGASESTGPMPTTLTETSPVDAVTADFRLSEREREVLVQLARGFSYEQIARELFISKSTVTYHLTNIYAKTGVNSRHQLTALLWQDRRQAA